MSPSENLRRLVNNCQLSQNEIAIQAGIDPGILSRFMNRKRDIQLSTYEKLLEVVQHQFPIDEQLRKAINDSGYSYRFLAEQGNCDHASISRFMKQKRSLNLETFQKLATVVGIR